MSPSPPSQLTLSDVARLAGVGLATASRALNDAPGVSPATRRRVLEVAREHHYVISPAASRLAAGATRRVGVVVPHLSRWFFGELVEGMQSTIAAAELDAVLYGVGDRADRHRFFDRLPARRNVDGMLVAGFAVDADEQRRLELLGVQIVSAGGQPAPYPYVCIDDLAAGRTAVEHLVSLGHTRIGTVESVDPDLDEPPALRSSAWSDVLQENGIRPDPSLRRVATWGGEPAADAMDELLALPDPPTAVYAHSDEVAIGVMRSIRRAGLRVPEDVSVIGIDDHPMAALTDLTTVHQPVRRQGELAGRLLAELITTGRAASPSVVVPTELVLRASTAPPRVS